MLVGALEVDLEAAHIAADVRLDILIRRGRLDEAQAAAQNARYRTIQYGEMLRQRTGGDQPRRAQRRLGRDRCRQFLDDALAHIEERYRAENAILVNLTEVRDTADTADRKAQAAHLVDVVAGLPAPPRPAPGRPAERRAPLPRRAGPADVHRRPAPSPPWTCTPSCSARCLTPPGGRRRPGPDSLLRHRRPA